MLTKAMRVPEGDFRDWHEIERWARAIAADLTAAPAHRERERGAA